jgi:hypothetical protein
MTLEIISATEIYTIKFPKGVVASFNYYKFMWNIGIFKQTEKKILESEAFSMGKSSLS